MLRSSQNTPATWITPATETLAQMVVNCASTEPGQKAMATQSAAIMHRLRMIGAAAG